MNLLLVPNPDRDTGLRVTSRAAKLLSEHGHRLSCTVPLPGTEPAVLPEAAERADAAIVFGGDGTLLRFSAVASRYGLPVIGVNSGNLGYLSELRAEEIDELPDLLSGAFSTEERMMLSVSVERQGKTVFFSECLNDAVVSYGELPHLVSFDLSEGGSVFSSYAANGMVFSTPTGSTAYSLSAGGPILDPRLNAIIATPVCAHSLTARPLVFSDRAQLSLRFTAQKKGSTCLTADGDRSFPLEQGDSIRICRSSFVTRLIRRTAAVPFGKILSEKMSQK